MLDDELDGGGHDGEIRGHAATVRARMTMVDRKPRRAAAYVRSPRRSFAAVAWVGSVLTAAFVLLRIAQLDDSSIVATAQSLTPYLLLPVWVALGYAVLSRRRALGALAAVLAATHVAWLVPEVRPTAGLDLATMTAPHVRVFSANVLAANVDVSDIIREIRDTQPDVLLIQEYGRGHAPCSRPRESSTRTGSGSPSWRTHRSAP